MEHTEMKTPRAKLADAVISELGGPSKVAKICEITQPSVSEWKKKGIPKAQEKYLRLRSPDLKAWALAE